MKAAYLISAAAAVLALSACGKSPEKGGNITAEDVAEKMSSVKLEAGQWEATQEIVDVQMTGLPEGAPDAAKAMIGHKTSFKHCITPEQAEKPSADFLAAQKDAKCTYSNMEMAGGTIIAATTCQIPQQPGAEMKMAMQGTYMPDHYAIAIDVDSSGMANGMGMKMKMKSSGKRIGDCPAGGE
ncbi:MAG: DUF3617 domain-containing protein [Sphingobium phenoxybenzoativorans]